MAGKLNSETEEGFGKADLAAETGGGFSPSFSKHRHREAQRSEPDREQSQTGKQTRE